MAELAFKLDHYRYPGPKVRNAAQMYKYHVLISVNGDV
jgi:hypothetical protein